MLSNTKGQEVRFIDGDLDSKLLQFLPSYVSIKNGGADIPFNRYTVKSIETYGTKSDGRKLVKVVVQSGKKSTVILSAIQFGQIMKSVDKNRSLGFLEVQELMRCRQVMNISAEELKKMKKRAVLKACVKFFVYMAILLFLLHFLDLWPFNGDSSSNSIKTVDRSIKH